MTPSCAADGATVVVTTASGSTSYVGLADGQYQFTAETTDAAYLVDVDVACDAAEPGVTTAVAAVGAALMPLDTTVNSVTVDTTATTETLVVEDPTLLGGTMLLGSPMPSSLPGTGGNEFGVGGVAFAMVLVGAALLRLVRRLA